MRRWSTPPAGCLTLHARRADRRLANHPGSTRRVRGTQRRANWGADLRNDGGGSGRRDKKSPHGRRAPSTSPVWSLASSRSIPLGPAGAGSGASASCRQGSRTFPRRREGRRCSLGTDGAMITNSTAPALIAKKRRAIFRPLRSAPQVHANTHTTTA
jgi:hypothetical protein